MMVHVNVFLLPYLVGPTLGVPVIVPLTTTPVSTPLALM